MNNSDLEHPAKIVGEMLGLPYEDSLPDEKIESIIAWDNPDEIEEDDQRAA